MTVKEIKEAIKDLPDAMKVYISANPTNYSTYDPENYGTYTPVKWIKFVEVTKSKSNFESTTTEKILIIQG